MYNVTENTCISIAIPFVGTVIGNLETILTHFLFTQHCLSLPGPPNFTLFLHAEHLPHSFAMQPLQQLHLCLLCLLPGYFIDGKNNKYLATYLATIITKDLLKHY